MSANNTDLAAGLATEAGWRPDPTGRYEWRYWDGGWTNRVASSSPEAATINPAPPAPAPAAPVAPAPPSVPPPAPPFPSPGAPSAAVVAALPMPRPVQQPTTPGWDPAPSSPTTPPPAPDGERSRRGIWARITSFFTSFANEQESYHSDKAVEIDPDPRGGQMLASTPLNYGRAGLVALSACGVAIGSYLPWMSGTIDGVAFRISGFEDGHGWSFTIGSLALVMAALLAVRWRVLRWVAIGLALALCGLTFRELVHTHDIVTTMNASAANEVDVGTGLWIMAGCAVVAMVASFRLGERD
jgi:hypothetical protein